MDIHVGIGTTVPVKFHGHDYFADDWVDWGGSVSWDDGLDQGDHQDACLGWVMTGLDWG